MEIRRRISIIVLSLRGAVFATKQSDFSARLLADPSFGGQNRLLRFLRSLAMTAWLATFSFGNLQVNWAYEIQGEISVAAPYPGPKKIQVKKKHHGVCASEQISQSLVVSEEGGLKNAVVSLKGNFESKTAADSGIPVLDQKSCNFQPHVLVVPNAKPFHVANSDPMDHDVRVFDQADMLFRFEMDAFDEPVEKQLDRAGTYVVRCGLHPWMHAFVVSAEHPYYAVSDQSGEFRLTGVPPGHYNLHIWHETLGEGQMPIEVEKDIHGLSYTFQHA